MQFTSEKGEEIEFSSSVSSNPPSYDIEEEVAVIYSSTSPKNAKIKSFSSLWLGTTITAVFSSIFFLIGIIILAFSIKKKKTINHLKRNGKKIEANFNDVEINYSLTVNGRNPYVISSQWQNPETSKVHIFTSDNIWFDPTKFISSDKIPVLIDRKNPKKYFVDLSFLPEIIK